MQTYAPAKISAKRSLTPEGFLICHDVRLARTGEMLYGPGQTPIPVGPDGVARIDRTEDVVFAADTLASFVGKAVTIKHPPSAVTPDTWREVVGGHIVSVRRGEGAESQFMVGDIMVTTPEAIDLANAGCEISCGYDAAYEQTGPGRGRQTKIVGNHLAFLPDGIKGRCGPMCYVGDQSMDIEEQPAMTTKPPFGVALMQRLFGAKDEADAQAILADMSRQEQAAQDAAKITALTADVAALTAEIAELTADEDAEETEAEKKEREAKEAKAKESTMDAAALTALAPRVTAAAEILSPGLTVPTVDSADLVATADALCACQKLALDNALKTPTGKTILAALIPDLKTDGMTADQIGANFFAAAALVGAGNNGAMAAALAAQTGGMAGEFQSSAQRSAEAAKRADEHWAARRAALNNIH